MEGENKKTIELWEGYSVELNEKLMDDFNFTSDLSDAINNNNLSEIIAMYMALIGGDDTYDTIRQHIEQKHGYFSQKALLEITHKIDDKLPKSGNRASRRSWKPTR